MKEVFARRRLAFLQRCSKYLRYVLNDHFVLVLMVFLGFVSLQYRQLLSEFPKNSWPVLFLLVTISLLLLFSGQVATYLEEADQTFLLAKEGSMATIVRAAGLRTFAVWGSVQAVVQLILLPLYLAFGLPVWGFAIVLCLLLAGKYLLIQRQLSSFYQQRVFDWSGSIQLEQKRKQGILRFFALFTSVKGVTTAVKRRSYLDWLLGSVENSQGRTWFYLYFRAFLRAGDYLGLTMRLTGLAVLVLFTIEEDWLAVGLVLVFHYLLLFQLLGLYNHYDYQYLVQLYPLENGVNLAGFRRLVKGILYLVFTLNLLLAFLLIQEKSWLFLLLAVGLGLQEIYLPLKIKKLID